MPNIIAAICPAERPELDVLVAWVKEQGFSQDDVKIARRGDVAWVERKI